MTSAREQSQDWYYGWVAWDELLAKGWNCAYSRYAGPVDTVAIEKQIEGVVEDDDWIVLVDRPDLFISLSVSQGRDTLINIWIASVGRPDLAHKEVL